MSSTGWPVDDRSRVSPERFRTSPRRHCDGPSRRTDGPARGWTRDTLLDASVLVDLLEGRPDATATVGEIDRPEENPTIPFPVLLELWESAEGSVSAGREGGEDVF